MLLSKYFMPTFKEDPADAVIASHKLMLRAGLIFQTASGIYSWLPLGLRVIEKIIKIIDQEQEKINSHKISMTTVQPASLWIESQRYDSYGLEMLRFKDRKETEYLYSPTNEEQATDIMRKLIKSYKELPLTFYQIQWKFRDEIRPRFGVLRSREFLMKDGYSFDLSYDDAVVTYKKMLTSYVKTFKRLGLNAVPVRANPGAIGGNLSHEFLILAETGESMLYYDKNLSKATTADEIMQCYAVSDEEYDEKNVPIPQSQLEISKGVEVGHIFYFGKKYSQSMNASVSGASGGAIFPEMGSYGIGVSRLVAAIIESSHDEKGIIWPVEVAPFQVIVVNLNVNDEKCNALSLKIYTALKNKNVEVIYDDKNLSVGEKFANADLIGIPAQIIVGKKNAAIEMAEFKCRKSGEIEVLGFDAIVNRF